MRNCGRGDLIAFLEALEDFELVRAKGHRTDRYASSVGGVRCVEDEYVVEFELVEDSTARNTNRRGFSHFESDMGEHAGQELALRIREFDDDRKTLGLRLGRAAYTHDAAFADLVAEGIDPNRGHRAGLDCADLAIADRHRDFNGRKVENLGDQRTGLEVGTWIEVERIYEPVEGGFDSRMTQSRACFEQRSIASSLLGLCSVELGLARDRAASKSLLTFEFVFGELVVGARPDQLGLWQSRVEAQEQVTR